MKELNTQNSVFFFFFLQTLILIHTTYTIVNKLSLDKPPHPFDAKSIPFT